MKLRTYQAYTMAEALAAVKRDLGQSAVILNTRTFKRGGFLGIGRKTVVEVTATAGEPATDGRQHTQPANAASAVRPKPVGASAARRAYSAETTPRQQESAQARAIATLNASASALGSGQSDADSRQPTADGPQRVTDDDRQRTRRLAQMMAAKFEQRATAAPSQQQPAMSNETPAQTAGVAAGSGETDAAFRSTQPSPQADKKPAAASRPPSTARADARLPDGQAQPARRFVLTAASDENDDARLPDGQAADNETAQSTQPGSVTRRRAAGGADEVRRHAGASSGRPRPAPIELFTDDGNREHTATIQTRVMEDELAAIRTMVGQVLQRQIAVAPTPDRHADSSGRSAPSGDMPQQLFDMYLKLLSQDISEELAERVLADVRDELSEVDLQDETKLREAILRHLTDYIPAAHQPVAPRSPDERPLTIALIGPTGVGKTTTLAKLAASFKLQHQRKVGLITSDTYRIAAVDQLRTYANIIGVPLEVAITPRDMEQAVHTLRGCDVILIDTAGRGQNDSSRLTELKQFIASADPHEVHLVLSGTASEKVLLREAEAFSIVGVDKIVLTKLDEAVSFGMLVNVIRRVGKELSFFTTGQEVPDHIEVGRPERLAELILGGKVHT